MSAPGASPDLQDLSQYPINFLVRDVDIEFAAFVEAQARAAPALVRARAAPDSSRNPNPSPEPERLTPNP